jgi:hypothetical protein
MIGFCRIPFGLASLFSAAMQAFAKFAQLIMPWCSKAIAIKLVNCNVCHYFHDAWDLPVAFGIHGTA